MLQQMFEVTFTRFHAQMQSFAPLIDSVVDHYRGKPETCESLVGYQAMRAVPIDFNKLEKG